MPARSRVALLAAAVLGTTACGAKRATYDPFQAPREQVGHALRVVALAPVDVPRGIEDPELVRARFGATIDGALRQAGVAIVPPGEVGPVVDAALERSGGLFDPKTGKLDEPKLFAARAEALQALAGAHGPVDAILMSEVRVVRAPLHNDHAAWDGVRERAGTSAWKAALGVTHSGTVRALSVVVWLVGPDGKELYVKSGGLRLLDKVDLGGNRVPVPIPELFRDEAVNARAVSLALDPLVEAIRTAATAPPRVARSGTAPTSPPPAADPRPSGP